MSRSSTSNPRRPIERITLTGIKTSDRGDHEFRHHDRRRLKLLRSTGSTSPASTAHDRLKDLWQRRHYLDRRTGFPNLRRPAAPCIKELGNYTRTAEYSVDTGLDPAFTERGLTRIEATADGRRRMDRPRSRSLGHRGSGPVDERDRLVDDRRQHDQRRGQAATPDHALQRRPSPPDREHPRCDQPPRATGTLALGPSEVARTLAAAEQRGAALWTGIGELRGRSSRAWRAGPHRY